MLSVGLHRVRVFVAAATAGSFTVAARNLHLSQSAVSQQISLLEGEIGEPLFIRINRRVRLSQTGERLLPSAQSLLNSWSNFNAEATSDNKEIKGPLTVGTSAAATTYLWSAIYCAFSLQYPGVEMDIKTLPDTRSSIRQVLTGDLDAAFTPLPLDMPGVESFELGAQEALLCASVSHHLANRSAVERLQLMTERFILFEKTISLRWLTDRFFARERLNPTIVLESNDTHLIRAMLEGGYGIGFLPDWSIQRELKEGRLRILQIRGAPLRQKLGLIFRKRSLSPPVRVFIEFCKANRDLLPETARDHSVQTGRRSVSKS